MQEIQPYRIDHPIYKCVVHLPRKVTGGKQSRKFFRDEASALDFCDDFSASIGHVGYSFFENVTEEERVALAKHLTQIRRTKKMNFSDLWDKFVEYQKSRNASPRYLEELRNRGRVLVSRWGDIHLNELQGGEIRAWILSLQHSQTTQHHYFRLMRTALNFGVSSEWISQNPCNGISRHIEKPDRPKGLLTPEEFKKLWDKATDVMKLWLAIGGFAGLRPTEVMQLEWRHIDFVGGEIHVPASITKQSKRSYTEGRVVVLTDNLRAILEKFDNRTGKVISLASTALNKRKWDMEKNSGIDIPADALRHSYATYLFTIKKDINYVASQLGHTGSMVTMRHYARRDVPSLLGRQWFEFGLHDASHSTTMAS